MLPAYTHPKGAQMSVVSEVPEIAPVVNAPTPTVENELKKNSLSTGGITFLVVSAAAPLTVIAGTAPLAILIAGEATPWAFLIAGAALSIFAVGFMAMARSVSASGGFYTYVTTALGKKVGLGAGILALVSYNCMQIGTYGLFAVNARTMLLEAFGVDVPWPLLAGIGVVLVWAMGFAGIDMGAKVLGVFLVAETVALLVLAGAILASGGGSEGLSFPLDPATIFTPQLAAVLGLAFGAFIGFESTALYQAEAKNPGKTIPRATYLSVALLTMFYAAMTWVLVQAYGPSLVQDFIGTNGVGTFVFTTAEAKLGHLATIVFLLLANTSVYAALLAFHNSVNRYTHALARDGVLPVWLGKSRRSNGSPWVAGLAQTLIATIVVAGFAIAGADPYMQLMIWVNTPGVIGVICLQILASIAVIVYFVRNQTVARKWYVVPAGVIGTAMLVTLTYALVTNIAVLTSADLATNLIILAAVPLSFLIGIVLAINLHRRRPDAYRKIGGQGQ